MGYRSDWRGERTGSVSETQTLPAGTGSPSPGESGAADSGESERAAAECSSGRRSQRYTGAAQCEQAQAISGDALQTVLNGRTVTENGS